MGTVKSCSKLCEQRFPLQLGVALVIQLFCNSNGVGQCFRYVGEVYHWPRAKWHVSNCVTSISHSVVCNIAVIICCSRVFLQSVMTLTFLRHQLTRVQVYKRPCSIRCGDPQKPGADHSFAGNHTIPLPVSIPFLCRYRPRILTGAASVGSAAGALRDRGHQTTWRLTLWRQRWRHSSAIDVAVWTVPR